MPRLENPRETNEEKQTRKNKQGKANQEKQTRRGKQAAPNLVIGERQEGGFQQVGGVTQTARR
jgi:hypothetical protein